EIEGVEGGAEIDEEGIVDGAGEDADAVVQSVNSLLRERGVVRHGAGTDVGGHGVEGLAGRDQAGAGGGCARAGDHGDGGVLGEAGGGGSGSIERGDGRGNQRGGLGSVGGERSVGRRVDSGAGSDESGEDPGSANLGGEGELEGDVLDGVVVVIDV